MSASTPYCYATMCIQSDSPGQQGRSWARTEPPMFRLFAALLLNVTKLPLYVIHNEPVNPLALLRAPSAQVRPFRADVIKSHVRSPVSQRHYESMYTKFHIWRLPCRQVAYIDYDVLALRSPDPIFAECGDAAFCAVQARGNSQRYFNGGVFVARPDNATYERFRAALDADAASHIARPYAEQDLLNAAYPDWKALPTRYNVQSIGSGKPWSPASDVLIHEKYWKLPEAARAQLHVSAGLPKPSWWDRLRELVGHLW